MSEVKIETIEKEKTSSEELVVIRSKHNEKYELTNYNIPEDFPFYRIRAFCDFADIKKGDFGGLVKSEENLSIYGDCWIDVNSSVHDTSRVTGDARVYNSQIIDGSLIDDNVLIQNSEIRKCFFIGNAEVHNSDLHNLALSGDVVVKFIRSVQDRTQIAGMSLSGDLVVDPDFLYDTVYMKLDHECLLFYRDDVGNIMVLTNCEHEDFINSGIHMTLDEYVESKRDIFSRFKEEIDAIVNFLKTRYKIRDEWYKQRDELRNERRGN